MFKVMRFHVPHGIRYDSDYYIKHRENLPGFEAVKFEGQPHPPYPEGYPFVHFSPYKQPDGADVQQNFASTMQDCIRVVLEGTKQNSSRSPSKQLKVNRGLVDLAQYELYMLRQG